jgi:predicted PurR-regulated permease PerM
MIDPVQAVLLIVIVVLTVLLVVLGVQVFLILKELRKTVKKTNEVLDNVGSITESIEEPLSAVSSLVLGFKTGSLFTVLKTINNFIGRHKDDKKDKN